MIRVPTHPQSSTWIWHWVFANKHFFSSNAIFNQPKIYFFITDLMRFLIVFIVIQAVVSQRCKMICKLFVWYIIYVYEHVTKQAHATNNSNKTPFDHSVLISYFTVFPSSVLSVCMSNYHFFCTFVMFYIPRIPTEAKVVTLKFNVSRDNRHY